MVKELIDSAIQRRQDYLKNSGNLKIAPPTPLGPGVPTLREGVYQPFSPQLTVRYEAFSRWEAATHGHWLGLHDMAALWQKPIADKLLKQIETIRAGTQQGWPNHASALFRPERLSLFAGSDLNNDAIYLLWLEFEDEPELWVYDSNGESHYHDLSAYLIAYMANDISASQRSWRV